MKKNLLLGFILFCIFHDSLCAQINDAVLWTGITAEKKISQSSSVYFNETFRFDENISELGNYFSEIGISKKINNGFGIGLSYRFINKRELNDNYSFRHRYFVDVSYKKKIYYFSISYRTRIQSQMENYFLPSEKIYGNTPENYWRNKLSVRYLSLKKIKPSLSAEIWYPLSNTKIETIDNLRCSAGIQYNHDKKKSIEIDYIIQKQFFNKNPQTDFITSLSYSFAF